LFIFHNKKSTLTSLTVQPSLQCQWAHTATCIIGLELGYCLIKTHVSYYQIVTSSAGTWMDSHWSMGELFIIQHA